MASIKAALLRVLAIVFCVFLLAVSPAWTQAQRTPPDASPQPVVPESLEQPSSEAPPSPATEPQDSADRPADSALPRSGRTYQQPPNPYDMEAMEAYDQEVYGEGR